MPSMTGFAVWMYPYLLYQFPLYIITFYMTDGEEQFINTISSEGLGVTVQLLSFTI